MKVFFWDFDMTIAYPRLTKRNSVVDTLREYVHALDDKKAEEVKSNLKLTYPWNSSDPMLSRMHGDDAWDCVRCQVYDTFIACGIEEKTAADAAGAVRVAISNAKRYSLYPDAIDTLRTVMARGARNVLLSNNYPELVDVVDKLGLTMYFDDVIVSDIVGCNKPGSEIFSLAKSRYPGAQFYMVGDNVENDIIGARDNGMTTVLVHAEASPVADYSFDDLKSVLTLL